MSSVPSDIERKRDRLLEIVAGYGRVAVAFSAGVDSTVVAMNSVRADYSSIPAIAEMAMDVGIDGITRKPD